MVARRCSWSRIAARSCSAWRCSVTSSWVETQPPPGSGSFFGKHDTAVACRNVVRVTLALSHAVNDHLAIGVDVAGEQSRILAVLDQLPAVCSPASRSVTTACTFPYNGDCARTMRACASNMHRPCDMLSIALSSRPILRTQAAMQNDGQH